MASLIRPSRPYPLPPTAEVVTRDGKRFVVLSEGGRRAQYPVTRDGRKYLKPAKKWYGQFADADGITRRVPLSANKEAARQMLAERVKQVELEKAGVRDPFAAHRATPLADHLTGYAASFADKGHTTRQADQAVGRCRAVFDGCRFRTLADLDAEAVEKWLARRRATPKGEGGFGVQTSNHYLTAAKAFANWCVRTSRLAANPFQHLRRMNAGVDVRHRRREFTADEFAALVAAAGGGLPIRGLSGPDRAMLYTVASFTGLRASELASLTATSFALDATPPVVTVAAAYSKHRREDVVPLHPELVSQLRGWLAGFAPTAPLWPGNWAKHFEASDLIKADLAAARADWLADCPADERERREGSDFLLYRDCGGRVADFHSLRHTFVTNLVRAGVQPKDAKQLARHSSITLTMDRYAHVSLHDTAAAVAKLNAPRACAAFPDALPDAQPGDGGDESVRAGDSPADGEDSREVPEISGRDGDCGEVRGVHPEGFEPSTFGSVDRCSIQLSYGCVCLFSPSVVLIAPAPLPDRGDRCFRILRAFSPISTVLGTSWPQCRGRFASPRMEDPTREHARSGSPSVHVWHFRGSRTWRSVRRRDPTTLAACLARRSPVWRGDASVQRGRVPHPRARRASPAAACPK